jgi:hypothetical protein
MLLSQFAVFSSESEMTTLADTRHLSRLASVVVAVIAASETGLVCALPLGALPR